MLRDNPFTPLLYPRSLEASELGVERLFFELDSLQDFKFLSPENFAPDFSEVKTPLSYIEKGRSILLMALLKRVYSELPLWFDETYRKNLEVFYTFPVWKELQLGSAYRYLAAKELNKKKVQLDLVQNKSGSAHFETGGHWRWAQIPEMPYHAELGLVWGILGELFKDQYFLDSAVKLGEWQKNTIDYYGKPFHGLLSKEKSASLKNLLIYNYLLFRFIGELLNNPQYRYLAEQQKQLLDGELLKDKRPFSLSLYVMDRYIDSLCSNREIKSSPFHLTQDIVDKEVGFIGIRNTDEQIILSLAGGGTGLGSFIKKDIGIIAYGPQYYPLSECENFGIHVPNSFSKRKSTLNQFDLDGGKLIAQGLVRMGSKESSSRISTFLNSSPSDIWLDIKQIYQDKKLYIYAHFIGMKEKDDISFSFFCKGNHLQIDKERLLNPRSFERYQGRRLNIYLNGEESKLKIFSSYPGVMEVIPLGGGESFWGSDFLIAYKIHPNEVHYSWVIESS